MQQKLFRYFCTVRKCIILLTCLAFLLPLVVKAQKEVKLISSRDYEARKEWGVNRFYKPVFMHEGSTLSADSSDYNPTERFFDAFGNVVITQPNGTVVYADKLHYIKDTRIAILTNNVRMVDVKGAVLTTNHLTYNLNSKIGTYTNGGRIINQTDTLNSKNGYYFENSQDAYFRHDVIVRTPETNIFTDTLRYNSLSKMAYFYGPTNIKGKNGGNLYTENGDYHTETDRARFGKNNLYTEGSKFLRGDSLYYDGKLGYGRAIKNVVFVDTVQQGILYGQRGIYLKKDESITMTEKAYMIMVTKSDSTSSPTDSSDSLQVDSLPDNPPSLIDSLDKNNEPREQTDSVYMSADTLYSRVMLLKDYNPIELNLQRDGGDLDVEEDDSEFTEPADSTSLDSTATMRETTDSLSVKPAQDSIITNQKENLSADSLIKTALKDSLSTKQVPTDLSQEAIKKAVAKTTKLQNDSIAKTQRELISKELAEDSLLIKEIDIPKVGQADSSFALAKKTALNKSSTDSTTLDTAKTRIVKAYHHMRIFKSDLQARADSAYYGYPDSIIRCYGKPMIWAQGSQLSGDTIYMQLKNQKLDNMLLKTNAFIVSTQLDSAKFNQVKGRKITGFFTDNKLDRMFVDGNAESIYYTQEENKISGMTKSIGSRIKIIFDNNEVSNIVNIRKTETSYSPLAAIQADKEILPGFIWKPKDRPKSKEEVINPISTEQVIEPDTIKRTAADSLKTDNLKGDSTTTSAVKGTSVGKKNNTSVKQDTIKTVPNNSKTDSLKNDSATVSNKDAMVGKRDSIPAKQDTKKTLKDSIPINKIAPKSNRDSIPQKATPTTTK
ncbi:OstA-like protein [Olivibacter domesticus]|uniref:OstA-like protein n=1 Tax=Olivibacter domesticus TaxID=407022 RepID=A0A1H7VIM5_OLID1|nr:OstA-like protein [Olivibacter domesticus]SEM08749.1 OstA-like protein [Olivibacter domesticus]